MDNIETKRFILRCISIKDLNKIYKILSDKDTTAYLNMNRHKCMDDTKKLLEEYLIGVKDGTKYPFAIINKDTKEFVGVFLIKLDLYDEDSFEFTVYINKKYWNQGIYTEILPYMIDYAFKEIKTGNFRGFVMEENQASARVLEKCNFKLEKVFEVPGIEGKIKSYLITKEDYFKSLEY